MADQAVYYKKIAPEQVAPEKVRLAERVLALVEKRLGLPPIEVIWCREIDFHEHRGWTYLKSDAVFVDEADGFWAKVHPAGSGSSRIYISTSAPEDKIAFVVGHECQHLADWRDDLYHGLYADPRVRRRLEDRADEFGRAIEKELRGV